MRETQKKQEKLKASRYFIDEPKRSVFIVSGKGAFIANL